MRSSDARSGTFERRLAIRRAFEEVRRESPFGAHMEFHRQSYEAITDVVLRTLVPGANILDFGAGSCDRVAILRTLGYRCSAFDDFGDQLYQQNGNRERILRFTERMQIDLRVADNFELPWRDDEFDMVMLHAVLEHLHDSPRDLLISLLKLLKPRGYLFITVPNAVNLRKRIDVLRGRTNLPPFGDFYEAPGPWRGHVREYVRDDIRSLARFLDLEAVELRSCHQMVHKLPRWSQFAYRAATAFVPGGRDSWLLLARK